MLRKISFKPEHYSVSLFTGADYTFTLAYKYGALSVLKSRIFAIFGKLSLIWTLFCYQNTKAPNTTKVPFDDLHLI